MAFNCYRAIYMTARIRGTSVCLHPSPPSPLSTLPLPLSRPHCTFTRSAIHLNSMGCPRFDSATTAPAYASKIHSVSYTSSGIRHLICAGRYHSPVGRSCLCPVGHHISTGANGTARPSGSQTPERSRRCIAIHPPHQRPHPLGLVKEGKNSPETPPYASPDELG